MNLRDYPLVDKELAGWMHSKGYDQQLDVQEESREGWASSGVSTGSVLFDAFVRDRDQAHPRHVCQHHRAVWCCHTGGKGSTGTLTGLRGGSVRTSKFNTAECEVLHL